MVRSSTVTEGRAEPAVMVATGWSPKRRSVVLETVTFPLAAPTAVQERCTAVTTYLCVPSGTDASVQPALVMRADGLLPQAAMDTAPVTRVT